MKPTRFRALRAFSSTALASVAAMALLASTPACKKSTESKSETAAPSKVTKANAKADTTDKATPVAPDKTADVVPENTAPAMTGGITGGAQGLSHTLKGTAKVTTVPPKLIPKKKVALKRAGKGVKKVTATHVVVVHPPTTVASGKQAVVKVTLTPTPGWKINLDFPTSLAVTASSGVTVEKAKLRKKDAASFGKDKAEFLVKFNAGAAGAKDFTAKFKFAMCTEETCDPKKELLAWKVNVK